MRVPFDPMASLRPLFRGRWTLCSAAMIAAYVLGAMPSLGPLLETHAHRQTQRAYTAVLYAERGIDPLRPPLPIVGPPGNPREFPIIQSPGALLTHGSEVDVRRILSDPVLGPFMAYDHAANCALER